MAVVIASSFMVLVKTINRSRAFLRIFDGHRAGPGAPTHDEKELLRGALVFAVGALDAYMSDLILEVVPGKQVASQPFREALKAIGKSDPGLALRVSLAGSPEASLDEFAWLWPEARTLDAGRLPALVDLYRAHRGLYGVRKLWPAARCAGHPWG